MGPCDRFTWGLFKGFGLGCSFDTFPYDLFITVFLGPIYISFGIGDDYLTKEAS